MKKGNKTIMLMSLSLLALPLVGCHDDTTLKPNGKLVDLNEAIAIATDNVQKQFSTLEKENKDGKYSKKDGPGPVNPFGYSFHAAINELKYNEKSKIAFAKTPTTEPYETSQTLNFELENVGAFVAVDDIEGNANEKFDTKLRADNIKGQYQFKIGKAKGSYRKLDPKAETKAGKDFRREFKYDNAVFNAYLANSNMYFDPTNNELRLLLKNAIDIVQSYWLTSNSFGSSLSEQIVGKYDSNNNRFTGGVLGSKYKVDASTMTEGIIDTADVIATSRLKTLEIQAYKRLCSIKNADKYLGFKALDNLYNEAFDKLTDDAVTVNQIPAIEAEYKEKITKMVAELDKLSDTSKEEKVDVKTQHDTKTLADTVVEGVNKYAKWLEAYILDDGSYSFYAAFDSDKAKNTLNEYKKTFEKELNSAIKEGKLTEKDKQKIINVYDSLKNNIKINQCEFVVNVGSKGFNYYKTIIDVSTKVESPFYELSIKPIKPYIGFSEIGEFSDELSFKLNAEVGFDQKAKKPELPKNFDDYADFKLSNIISK